jgi:hypothetical protein
MIGGSLIGLRKGMMIALTSLIVPETANVWLSSALLLNLNCDDFDLVISKAYFNFEHCRHDEFVCFD